MELDISNKVSNSWHIIDSDTDNFKISNSWHMMSDELDNNIISPPVIDKESFKSISIIDSFGYGEKNNEDEQLSIGDILSTEYKNLSEIKILKYQLYISSQLKKYAISCRDKNINFDIALHLPKLEWLLETCSFLEKKRSQKEIKNNKKIMYGIKRNSYEFCELSDKCNKLKKCKKKHYVYNYIKSDIIEIINYINNYNNNFCIKELCISLNTINYVFKHMYDELLNTLNKLSSLRDTSI